MRSLGLCRQARLYTPLHIVHAFHLRLIPPVDAWQGALFQANLLFHCQNLLSGEAFSPVRGGEFEYSM
jgi:hypothetical protein